MSNSKVRNSNVSCSQNYPMSKLNSTLHCRFTTFTASWKYSKWSKPSGANPTTVAGTRIPLERV